MASAPIQHPAPFPRRPGAPRAPSCSECAAVVHLNDKCCHEFFKKKHQQKPFQLFACAFFKQLFDDFIFSPLCFSFLFALSLLF